jgi:hypothetical protein
MVKIIMHVQNEDPILGEVDTLPSPTDVSVMVKNPTRKDGKELTYLEADVTTVIWPFWKINFIEIVPEEETGEEIISFVREK